MNIEFFIYDEITPTMARELGEALRAKPQAPVLLRVNSYGGDLGAGLAMLNALRAHRGPIRVEIEGICASSATLFCCVGKVRMSESGVLMIHTPWVAATGNARDLRDHAEGLDKLSEAMATAYRQKTGKPAAEIAALLDGRDHWFSAAEAKAFVFVDEIIPGLRVAARLGNLKLPERFKMSETPLATPSAETPTVNAAVEAALARERTRQTEIKNLLVGHHANDPKLLAIQAECLIDPSCDAKTASGRMMKELGSRSEPLMSAGYDSGPGGGWALQPSGFTAPCGALARDFAASERAARIGNPVPFGGFGSRDFVRAASDALAVRMGARPKSIHPAAQDFRETGLTGLAALCLRATGQDTIGKSRASIVHGAMTTSDFPELLSTAGNKSLVNRFESLTLEHRQICDSGDLVDFKPAKVINTSFLPGLERKHEAGEITFGSITEGAETYKLATYARGLLLTREAMINDDLGAFDGLIRAAANSAARLERDLVFGVLTANANMADGVALFHNTRGNLDSSAAAIDATGLSKARVLMRKQRDSSGGYVMTAPKFIVCPVALESDAEALISALSYRPDSDTEIANPQWIRGLLPVSDPRLDAADWYLLSDPNVAAAIRLGYLNGVQNPAMEQDVDFDKDVLKFKIRFDVACAAVGYAGAVKMA